MTASPSIQERMQTTASQRAVLASEAERLASAGRLVACMPPPSDKGLITSAEQTELVTKSVRSYAWRFAKITDGRCAQPT
jgi:hypothetical protein